MKPFPHRRSRRLSAIAIALLAVSAGCVKQDDPGMDVVALEADIVFGIDEAPKAVEPVGFVPPAVEQVQPEVFEDLPVAPRVPRPVPVPPPTGSSYVCPTVGLGEFAEAAPVDVTTRPAEGTYAWRPGPPTVLGTDHFDLAATDLFDRVIFNVSEVTETTNPAEATEDAPEPTRTFTYQMATYGRGRDDTVVLDSYKVVTGGVAVTASNPANVGPTFYTGSPDRGVSLVSRQVLQNGRVVSAFAPSTPVLLLPLPAVGGSTFQSVSVDPVYGTTYMLYGEVKQRARVDACGKEVDGWEVVAQTALRDPREGASAPPHTATLTYIVSTGLGGVLSHEGRTKLELPRFPVNGTPLDGALPPNPELPENATTAADYAFSLASRAPGPITRPTPSPSGALGGD